MAKLKNGEMAKIETTALAGSSLRHSVFRHLAIPPFRHFHR
jgi:hypothetical protein